MSKKALGTLVLVLGFSGVGVGAADEMVIRNATILTITKGTFTNGSILIRDGKIAEVGTSVSVPSGADVLEAKLEIRKIHEVPTLT